MRVTLVLAALLLGLVAVTHASPANLDDEYESRRDFDDDDDDEKRPYSFAWEASRYYHGAPDREHREERGEDGITRGVYRYVDPNLRVREVIYTADENGFHVENPTPPEYTEAQVAVRERHAQLFQQIADEHVQIGADHVLKAQELGYELEPYVEPPPTEYSGRNPLLDAPLPEFSPAVERARARHQLLFEHIAEQHSRIAAERKTNPEDEETGEPYEYQYDTPLKTVEVVSGFVGPSVVNRANSVTAPGENHPDFQGYGVPLATFRDDLTEEEALRILEEENERHLRLFHEEADNHETLVLSMGMSGNAGPVRRQGVSNQQRQGQNSLRQSGGRKQNQHNSQYSGNKQQHSSGRTGKVQSGNSPHRHNQNLAGQENYKRNQAQFQTESHHQRAIGYQANVNTNEAQSHDQYSAGQSGHQGSKRTGGQNQYSSNQQGSGVPGTQHGQNQYSAQSGGNKRHGQGQHSTAQLSAGNNKKTTHQNRAQLSTQSSVGTTNQQGNTQYQGNQPGRQQGDKRSQTSAGTANHQGNTRYQGNQPGRQQGNKRSQTSGGTANHQGNTQYQGSRQAGHQGNKRSQVNVGNTQDQAGNPGRPLNTVATQHSSNTQSKFSSGNHNPNKRQQGNRSQSGTRKYKNNNQNVGEGPSAHRSGGLSSSGQFSSTGPHGLSHSSFHQSGASSHRQTGNPQSYDQTGAAHQAALAIIADQTQEHLRQFKKIAEAHEQIGDEHHQLTLSAIQKHRMLLEKQW